MSSFTTPAQLEPLSNDTWKVLSEFDYCVGTVENPTDIIKVPAGFITDLASIPRIFWNILPPFGEYTKASIIHDYMYTTHCRPKEVADKIFLEAMEVLGVASWRRNLMYYAVKYFGSSSYGKS